MNFPTTASGQPPDFAARIRVTLPMSWFPQAAAAGAIDQAPVLTAMLAAFSSSLTPVWQLQGAVSTAARLATSHGSFLDIWADDYFGPQSFPRNSGEGDAAYRARIAAALVRSRNTRAAVTAAIQSVTGVAPIIVETLNAHDCKGRGSSSSPAVGGGYGRNGLVRRGTPQGGQFYVITPLGNAGGAWQVAQSIASTKAEGVLGWYRIGSS